MGKQKATLLENGKWLLSTMEESTGEADPANYSPVHYGDWEVGNFIRARQLGFYEGNIVKYIDRYKKKDGIKDLKKARNYLDKLIEETENAISPQ